MQSVPQVCILLFLLLVINTKPQAVAGAWPRNTTRFSTYFALQAREGVGGAGGGIDRVAFIELLQSIQRIHEPCGPLKAAQPGNCMTGAFQYYEHPPCMVAGTITV